MIDIKTFKPDETSKSSLENKSFDPDKRIDVKENKTDNTGGDKGFDPDRRADITEVEPLKWNQNKDLEGKTYPDTGVPYVRKIVDLGYKKVEGVFAVFDSKFDTFLPKEFFQSSDTKQFSECNKQLKAALEQHPSLREKFTPEQIEQIMNGETPDGYVWHHNEEPGKMQLVDFETHDKTPHTGGKSIWGGGKECR